MSYIIVDIIIKVIFDITLLLILVADLRLYYRRKDFNEYLEDFNKKLNDRNRLLNEQNKILKQKLNELCRRDEDDK